jgi:osmotically-inducible protein OsmY
MLKAKYLSAVTSLLALTGTLSAYAAEGVIVYPGKDARITAEVRGAIAQHPGLGAPNQIYVATHHQVVYLSGIAVTALVADNAEDVARHVPGVSRVISNVSVDE